MKQALSPADRRALELPIGVAADEAATDAWLAREAGKDSVPLADRAVLDDTLSDQQRLILLAKIGARESAEESHRFATVKGLDDRLAAVTATIATRPAFYRPGRFAALAEAYADTGAPEQADETRRLARLESYFRTFAQAGVAAQQRHLDDLAGPERAMAETILRHQDDAFARDAYAAGTALYPDVGPSLPEEDADGRLRQARMIEAMRGRPLARPTADGIEGAANDGADPNIIQASLTPDTADPDEPQVDDDELAQAKPQPTPSRQPPKKPSPVPKKGPRRACPASSAP